MEVDSEKLLSLIKARTAIYNYNTKDHTIKPVIDKHWDEIAEEMQLPVADCKSKWASLRNSYARQMREERLRRANGKRRRKWYLTDSMSFLKNYLHPHGNTRIQSPTPDIAEIDVERIHDTRSTSSATNISMPLPIQVNKPTTPAATKSVPPPTPQCPPPEKQKDDPADNANRLFFRSILADFEKLSKKSQRKFRMRMMQLMNEVQEEEENETIYSATPDTYNSSSITIEHYKYDILQ